MEHDEAIRSHAAVRYAAHALSPEERKAFEEHFFACKQCAKEVHFEMSFPLSARIVEAPSSASAGSWEKWRYWVRLRPALASAFAANVVLAAGLGYVLLTSAHESVEPRLTQFYFAPGPTHGAGDVHTIPAGESYYGVRFPAPNAASQSYAYEILNADGRRESSASLKAPAGGDANLYLQAPIRSLPQGIHTLVIRAPDGQIVSWSKFRTSR
jgi:hypothetical protein